MPAFLRRAALLLPLLLAPTLAQAVTVQDRYFISSDGVRLHYLEAGHGPSLVFVPGWAMPAWIWQGQIAAFSDHYHVVAFDPRGQGDSDIAPNGYEPFRRGQDIADLIRAVGGRPVVLVGWSLGVLDSLAYVHGAGDALLAGLVLIDNSVGEEPAPAPVSVRLRQRHPRPVAREVWMRGFVNSMFRTPQDPGFLDRLTDAALRMPAHDAAELLEYPVPRSFWREAVYMVHKPVLYAITPKWTAQADNLALHDPYAQTAVFPGCGHALFIDDAARFDAILANFLTRRVGW
jgi:microsomal epoxide hydrolase